VRAAVAHVEVVDTQPRLPNRVEPRAQRARNRDRRAQPQSGVAQRTYVGARRRQVRGVGKVEPVLGLHDVPAAKRQPAARDQVAQRPGKLQPALGAAHAGEDEPQWPPTAIDHERRPLVAPPAALGTERSRKAETPEQLRPPADHERPLPRVPLGPRREEILGVK